jgi:hypothetical protein
MCWVSENNTRHKEKLYKIELKGTWESFFGHRLQKGTKLYYGPALVGTVPRMSGSSVLRWDTLLSVFYKVRNAQGAGFPEMWAHPSANEAYIYRKSGSKGVTLCKAWSSDQGSINGKDWCKGNVFFVVSTVQA